MELRHLRSFAVLCDELHFSRAAERLHVTQPSLTQQIRRLEQEVGASLFVRTTRRVEVTPAGQELRARAERILLAVDDAADATARAGRGERGRLAVGFSGTSTYKLLPTVTRAFHNEFPEVKLELHGELLTPSQVTSLIEGPLDVGFLRPPVGSPELAVRVLRREPLAVLLPEQHPLADEKMVDLSSLATEPFVAHPSRGGASVMYSTMLRICLDAGFQPHIVQEAAQTSVVASLVAAGFGVALLPIAVRHIQVTGAVLRPLKSDTRMELAVAWRRSDESALLRRFFETVENVQTSLEASLADLHNL